MSEVKVHKEEVPASRRTRVDLSESKPKNPNQSGSKKNHKPQWFCHFCGGAGHTRLNCFKLQALKQASKQKVLYSKAQDPMTLIHELVKVLNLYANTGADTRANSNRNPNSKFASKSLDAKDSSSVSLFDIVLMLIISISCDQNCCSLGFAFALHSYTSF